MICNRVAGSRHNVGLHEASKRLKILLRPFSLAIGGVVEQHRWWRPVAGGAAALLLWLPESISNFAVPTLAKGTEPTPQVKAPFKEALQSRGLWQIYLQIAEAPFD